MVDVVDVEQTEAVEEVAEVVAEDKDAELEALIKRRVDEVIAERLAVAPVKRVGEPKKDLFISGLLG